MTVYTFPEKLIDLVASALLSWITYLVWGKPTALP